MTLVKVNHRPVGRSVDNLFDEVFSNFQSVWGHPIKENTFGIPPANIYETNNSFELELNVPGRNKEDFKLNVEDGILKITYQKAEENKSQDSKAIRSEFNFTSFNRSFNLDDKIDVNNIKAVYENGLLKLHLPKKQEAKEEKKQINIQ